MRDKLSVAVNIHAPPDSFVPSVWPMSTQQAERVLGEGAEENSTSGLRHLGFSALSQDAARLVPLCRHSSGQPRLSEGRDPQHRHGCPLLRPSIRGTRGIKVPSGVRTFQGPLAHHPARQGALQARARAKSGMPRAIAFIERRKSAPARARLTIKLPWRAADAPSRRCSVRLPNFRGGAFRATPGSRFEQRPETVPRMRVLWKRWRGLRHSLALKRVDVNGKNRKGLLLVISGGS